MTLQVQFATMGMMLLGGLSLGGLFDLYRVLAGQLRAPRYAYYLLDLVFWFIGTLLVFKLLYEINWGQVRLFIFIGLLVGIVLYFLLLSGLVTKLILQLVRIVKALIRFGGMLFKYLIIKPFLWIFRTTVVFFGFLCATAIFLCQLMLQLIYPVWRLLLWMTKPLVRRFRVPAWINKTVKTSARVIRWLFDRT
jgi:spore cortex biosynthesis protein YabQ